jgi:hypothetical protein
MIGNLGKTAADIVVKIKADTSDYNRSLKNTEGTTSAFASKMARYGKTLGLSLGVAAAGFTVAAVKMAAAEEVVSRQTASLLKAQGVMWEDVGQSLDAYLKQLELLTGYNDTDLQEAFNSMIAAGMSYTEALDSMNTVTSMSYSLGRDLSSMALLVGKAYNGQTGELSRYGIVLDETLSKEEKFAGLNQYVADNFADASDRTETLAGQMDVLKNSMFNVAEEMGAELLPDLIDDLESLNKWGQEGGWQDTAYALTTIADALRTIGKAASVGLHAGGMMKNAAQWMFLDDADVDAGSYKRAVGHTQRISEIMGFTDPYTAPEKRYFTPEGEVNKAQWEKLTTAVEENTAATQENTEVTSDSSTWAPQGRSERTYDLGTYDMSGATIHANRS